MLSIFSVLSKMVTTVSLSAPPTIAHIRRWADISHITSQKMLGRFGYSCWQLVAGYVCEVLQYSICRLYYVTAEWCWWPEWVGVWYHARTHVLHVHYSPAQTAFMNTHRPTRRPLLDKQGRLAIIISTTVMSCVITVASDNWSSLCPLKFPTPPTDDHPRHRPPLRSAAWVVVRGGWRKIWI